MILPLSLDPETLDSTLLFCVVTQQVALQTSMTILTSCFTSTATVILIYVINVAETSVEICTYYLFELYQTSIFIFNGKNSPFHFQCSSFILATSCGSLFNIENANLLVQ